jgi:hypothetical protein
MNKKQLKRMLELSDIKPITENRNDLSAIELLKKASDNKVYGVIRENRKYYIKTSDNTENLTESDFDYIGGVHNKPKYSYRSFEDATRHLNLMFEEINRTYGNKEVNILESDVELLDEKKFVLKQPKKSAPAPELDFGGNDFDFGGDTGGDEPSFDFGDDSEGGEFDFADDSEGDEAEFDMDSEDDMDLGDEDLEDGDPIKDIQKTTGKLGQQLRDTEDLSSDMEKWVAKSVLAALDLDSMDSSDKKDLIRTIKKKKEDSEDIIDTEDDDSGEDFEVEEEYDSHMSDDFEYDYDDMPMSDVDMGIEDKAYLNIDPSIASGTEPIYGPNDDYDSYMEDDGEEGLCKSCMGSGCSHCAGLGFVDETSEDNPKIGGDEDLNVDDLLLDDEEIDYIDPRGTRMADKDIKSHYNNPSFDEMGRGHTLPYDTEFDFELNNDYDSYMNDTDLHADNDEKFDTIEDELGLPPATSDIDETDYEHNDLDTDVEFVDPLNDMEVENEKYDSYMREDDPTMSPGPAPARPAPTKEPGTKPGKPGTDRPARPSKRPFTPPPHITPGEEPGPKAGRDDLDVTFE